MAALSAQQLARGCEGLIVDASWLKFFPGFVRTRLSGRFEAQEIVSNSSWLFADKIVRAVVGIAVGVWMARYLGTIGFGQLSYAIAYVSIFSAIAAAGLDSIVVRELVRHPAQASEIVGSAFVLKLVAGMAALILTLATITISGADRMTFFLVAIVAGTLIFQAFDIVDFWFQAQVQSRFVVVAKLAGFLLASIIRILLILVSGSLISFALANLAEIAIGALCMALAFTLRGLGLRGLDARSQTMRHLLRDSWPLLLSSVAVMLYMRIDVVMLQVMAGAPDVGVYAAATRLSEVWYALPMIIVASASPSILRAHACDASAFLARLQRLYFLLAWLGIGISLPLSLGANAIVRFLYGSEFAAAGPVLAIHMWASIAVFLGVASSQYLLAENLQRISFYRTAIGLLCNVLLNLVLIPRFGAAGAAGATVISYFVATFSLVFFRRTRSHTAHLLFAPFAGRNQVNLGK